TRRSCRDTRMVNAAASPATYRRTSSSSGASPDRLATGAVDGELADGGAVPVGGRDHLGDPHQHVAAVRGVDRAAGGAPRDERGPGLVLELRRVVPHPDLEVESRIRGLQLEPGDGPGGAQVEQDR